MSHHVQDSTKKSAIFSRLDKKQDSSSPLTKIKVTLDDSKIARSVNTIRSSHPDDQMESSRNLLKRPAPNSGIVFYCYNCLHLTFLVVTMNEKLIQLKYLFHCISATNFEYWIYQFFKNCWIGLLRYEILMINIIWTVMINKIWRYISMINRIWTVWCECSEDMNILLFFFITYKVC